MINTPALAMDGPSGTTKLRHHTPRCSSALASVLSILTGAALAACTAPTAEHREDPTLGSAGEMPTSQHLKMVKTAERHDVNPSHSISATFLIRHFPDPTVTSKDYYEQILIDGA